MGLEIGDRVIILPHYIGKYQSSFAGAIGTVCYTGYACGCHEQWIRVQCGPDMMNMVYDCKANQVAAVTPVEG